MGNAAVWLQQTSKQTATSTRNTSTECETTSKQIVSHSFPTFLQQFSNQLSKNSKIICCLRDGLPASISIYHHVDCVSLHNSFCNVVSLDDGCKYLITTNSCEIVLRVPNAHNFS